MPQIAQIGEIYASQLFWLAIFFGAIFVVIGLGMLPKIQSTVDARDAKIAADLEVARGAREAADSLEEGYRAEMDKSRAEAARLAAEAKASGPRRPRNRSPRPTRRSRNKIDTAIAKIAAGAGHRDRGDRNGRGRSGAGQLVGRVAGLNVDAATARAAVAKELVHG